MRPDIQCDPHDGFNGHLTKHPKSRDHPEASWSGHQQGNNCFKAAVLACFLPCWHELAFHRCANVVGRFPRGWQVDDPLDQVARCHSLVVLLDATSKDGAAARAVGRVRRKHVPPRLAHKAASQTMLQDLHLCWIRHRCAARGWHVLMLLWWWWCWLRRCRCAARGWHALMVLWRWWRWCWIRTAQNPLCLLVLLL